MSRLQWYTYLCVFQPFHPSDVICGQFDRYQKDRTPVDSSSASAQRDKEGHASMTILVVPSNFEAEEVRDHTQDANRMQQQQVDC